MTIPARNLEPHRRAAQALAVVALTALALLVTGQASAAESCGKKVIDDWYADGRVDGTYPPHCYDDAIEILPRDVRDYSSAKDDITRALQNRLNNKPAPPATTDPTPGEDEPPAKTTTTETPGGKSDPPTNTTKAGDPSDDAVAGAPLDTAGADSVPVPLLILGGLALLLVAAGSAGYLTRRLQARRLPPPGA